MTRNQWFLCCFFSFAVFSSMLLSRPVYAAEYQDSGFVYLEDTFEEPPQVMTVEESIVCLHRDVHFFIFTFVPFLGAVLVFVLGCVWFSHTFIPK